MKNVIINKYEIKVILYSNILRSITNYKINNIFFLNSFYFNYILILIILNFYYNIKLFIININILLDILYKIRTITQDYYIFNIFIL